MEEVKRANASVEIWAGVLIGVDFSILILGALCLAALRWLASVAPGMDLRATVQALAPALGGDALMSRGFLIWSTVAQFVVLALLGLYLAWRIRHLRGRALILAVLSVCMALAIWPSIALIERLS